MSPAAAQLAPPSPSTQASNRNSAASQSSVVSSSATSFHTAPLSASLSSPSSSVVTVGPSSPDYPSQPRPPINPMHSLVGSQEVHVLRVTDDSVKIQAGPPPDTLLQRAGKAISRAVHAGPPPPSPPASIGELEEDENTTQPTQRIYSPRLTMPTQSEPPVSHTEPQLMPIYEPAPEPARSLRRASTDTRASLATVRLPLAQVPPQQPSSSTHPTPAMSLPESLNKPDHRLHPPSSLSAPRPERRNTTGSTPILAPRLFHRYPQPQHVALDDAVMLGLELASDIALHAEQIRRERQSKRAKQQQQAEAEAALTRSESRATRGTRDDDDKPLVGNLIGEDHVNYVLMYNMLTGIRIGVSRCQAKMKRLLTDEDFIAKHKYSFDIVGNELTPSAKYDFKFKDYAPWVFRILREDFFCIDPADYLLSLTAKYILSELGSPGKSGSFFYFSRDYRFIIKTIHHSEHKFLLKTLKQYYEHVQKNPHTLLSRFYGLHRVKLPRGRKIHFVIMNNLFPPHKDIHETYDLKGSTVGREYPEEKAKKNPRAVLKDLNWINRAKQLELGPEKRALLTEQLRRDMEYLKSVDVMDYSLLVGLHNMQRGNRDNVRKKTLKVFSPDIPQQLRIKQSMRGTKTPEAIAMRRAMRSSDPKSLSKVASSSTAVTGTSMSPSAAGMGVPPNGMIASPLPSTPGCTASPPSTDLNSGAVAVTGGTLSAAIPEGSDSMTQTENADDIGLFLDEDTTGDRQHFLFYQDQGGLQATDEENGGLGTIYYLGIIDILTPYGVVKRAEHWWKSLLAVRGDRKKISQLPPDEYGDRFFAFMKAIMRDGEGGARFK